MTRSIILSLIAVISCIVVLPALAGTWRDDFEDGNFDGWGLINPAPEEKWAAEGGECSGQWTPGIAGMYSPLELKIENAALWKDYTVVCRAKLLEKFGASWIMFGIDVRKIPNGGTTYGAWIDLESNQACLYILNRKVSVVPFDIVKDKWYELKVTAKKNHIEFYINDELMGSLDDSSYPSGAVDLGVASVHVHFDDVIITGPEIPDGGPGSISVRQKDWLATTWGTLKQKH